jgi:glycosyltransferase involved in cell wall biosynthesis
MKKVVIIQRILPHYRIPFFERLFQVLAEKNIELIVIYGQHRENTVPKSVNVDRPWALKINNYYLFSENNEVVWQPCFLKAVNADLVIIEQANRLLINYLFLLTRKFIKPKIALWGHGRNFQSINPDGLLESWKKWLSKQVDWWFAYTQSSAELVKSIGFAEKKITITQNAICTESLIQAKNKISSTQMNIIKMELGISGDNIVIYCGGIYEQKKMCFLIGACKEIKKQVDDFHVIFIGDGPEAFLVKKFDEENQWVHYLGEKLDTDIVPYFSISKLMLMPGLVGLSVVDSFALEVPIVSTDIPIHSPEFSYLENGINAQIVKYDLKKYSDQVSKLLINNDSRNILLEGCKTSSKKYQLNNMTMRFVESILGLMDKRDE